VQREEREKEKEREREKEREDLQSANFVYFVLQAIHFLTNIFE